MLTKNKFTTLAEKNETKRAGLWFVCAISFVWLVIVVPFLSLHNDGIEPFFSPANKGNQDLANYYMAGSIVLEKDFKSLYPVPKEGIQHNVGWPDCSTVKPDYARLADEKGVEDSFRFILPPPSAALFVPFALLPYPLARWVWVGFLGLCLWGCCGTSYHITRKCGGTRTAGMIWWMVWAFSPLALKALRTANSTPILALAMGAAAIGVFTNKTVLAIIGCILAGLLKGTSIIFAPLLLLMKRFLIIGWGAILVILINAVTLALAGFGAYEEFFISVYPSTQTVDPLVDNQSVYGFLYRIFGEVIQQKTVMETVNILGLILMTAFIALLWKLRDDIANNYRSFNASVVGLVGLYLIFRPYNWGHYALCCIPFMAPLWISIKQPLWKAAMLISISLLWMPWVGIRGGTLLSAEPLTSHMLIGEIILIAVSLHILASRVKPKRALTSI
jgi:hypothetical protein